MVSIYYIIKEDEEKKIPFNETALLKIIKGLHNRNKPLYNYYVNLWENLEGKKFSEKYLEWI